MRLSETPLFDPALLMSLDWSHNDVEFNPTISPASPGEGLVMRPLCTADFNKGFMKVLSQLTHVGEVTEEQFIARFESLKKAGGYFIVVVEDTKQGTIVATGTLMVEQKFIHCCGTRGRMEDVVVTDECRGKQLGKLLLVTLKLLSKRLGCYKITLECLPKNVAFYEKFDYKTSPESYMQCRFLP